MGEEESGVVFESALKLTLRDRSGCQLSQVGIPPPWVHRATQVSPEAEFSDQFSAILTVVQNYSKKIDNFLKTTWMHAPHELWERLSQVWCLRVH